MIDLQSVCHVPDLNWSLSLQDFCQYTAGETKVFPNSLSVATAIRFFPNLKIG